VVLAAREEESLSEAVAEGWAFAREKDQCLGESSVVGSRARLAY